ncbi:hypothetical protein GA830_18665 (plasmid) [Mesorhizobium sp. NBSH29]|uniref:hypothetical protein n=1 Tax=Mesorhizobium sp. NBSH29 TaxID=2654249 RepID=UPI0018964A29|nr:hypothetical protein [Mesorhizobium sp. NBSH29]QPC88893.1 hypothetical protein GA830_18665 [Mesorhizobium sp. NBSH29]
MSHAASLVCLNAMPPVYVDAAAGIVGRIVTVLAPRWFYEMLDGPEHSGGAGGAVRRATSCIRGDIGTTAPPPTHGSPHRQGSVSSPS